MKKLFGGRFILVYIFGPAFISICGMILYHVNGGADNIQSYKFLAGFQLLLMGFALSNIVYVFKKIKIRNMLNLICVVYFLNALVSMVWLLIIVLEKKSLLYYTEELFIINFFCVVSYILFIIKNKILIIKKFHKQLIIIICLNIFLFYVLKKSININYVMFCISSLYFFIFETLLFLILIISRDEWLSLFVVAEIFAIGVQLSGLIKLNLGEYLFVINILSIISYYFLLMSSFELRTQILNKYKNYIEYEINFYNILMINSYVIMQFLLIFPICCLYLWGIISYAYLSYLPEYLLWFIFITIISLKIIFDGVNLELNYLVKYADSLLDEKSMREKYIIEIGEFRRLKNTFRNVVLKINQMNKEKVILQEHAHMQKLLTLEEKNKVHEILLKKRFLETISRKDANLRDKLSLLVHDIKSPTAMINHITQKINKKNSFNQSDINTLLSANSKINVLAQRILQQYKEIDPSIPEYFFNLYLLLDSNIKELMSTYEHVKFQFNVKEDLYFLMLYGVADNFDRMIVNILKNASEAITKETEGIIDVSVSLENDKVLLFIRDNGVGFNEQVKKSILARKILDSNKIDGSGFGLKQIYQTLEDFHIDLDISSEVGAGTEFCLSIPASTKKEWMCDQLNITHNTKIIILDDDPDIFILWENIFNDYVDQLNLQVNYFNSVDSLNTFWENAIIEKSEILFLCDYELDELGEVNGLNVVRQLQIPNSILVTNLSENRELQKEVSESGIKLLNKQLIQYLQLNIPRNLEVKATIRSSEHDLIWLDDQEFFPSYWIENHYGHLKTKIFSTVEDFMNGIDNYAHDVIIVLDNNLAVDINITVKGVDLAKILLKKGFKNIVIISGEAIDEYLPEVHFINKNDENLLSQIDKLF